MRIANISGRAALIAGSFAVDVERASEGQFQADPQRVWDNWHGFAAWAREIDVATNPTSQVFAVRDLEAPVPRPSQVFAIGLNYADHAAETGLAVPDNPVVFTKFASSLTGPEVTVRLSGERVDWEAELVVVVGVGGRDLPAGWDAVAGLMVGQDLSDRTVQSRGRPPQFSMGKSFAGYAPTGPAVVTLDELRTDHDLNALRIRCKVSDGDGTEERTLQDGNTGNLVFSVPALIGRLSEVVELRPGDLIFTGTPAGVGVGRTPPEFLRHGQQLTTEIDGLGTIRQQLVAR